MVNDILINTETDFEPSKLDTQIIYDTQNANVFFKPLIYNKLKVYTYCVSWRTDNKILSFHLLFFISYSGANGGLTYCYLQGQQHTNIQDTVYMLVTVIQHLMAIIKSIFLFFSTVRPCFDLLNNHWDLPNQRALFTVYPLITNKVFVSYCMCIFWAVRSFMRKESERTIHTCTHRQN